MTIGIYHVFQANRRVKIQALEKIDQLKEFEFLEIHHWKRMETALVDLIVVFSPEFLPSYTSVQEFKRFLTGLNKTLIIVAYDSPAWRLDRSKTFYLGNPDKPQTMEHLKNILLLEKSNRSEHHKNPISRSG